MKIIYTLFLLLLTQIAWAQPGKFKEKKEQIKALKGAHITNELKLTSNEAEKFWPIYNEFEDKMHELRRGKLKNILDNIEEESLDNLSEKEANNLILQMENAEEETYLLKKKLITKLKTVLPAVKIVKLKRAEEQFSRKLLQQYKGKK